jgi:hypothetical protein
MHHSNIDLLSFFVLPMVSTRKKEREMEREREREVESLVLSLPLFLSN